ILFCKLIVFLEAIIIFLDSYKIPVCSNASIVFFVFSAAVFISSAVRSNFSRVLITTGSLSKFLILIIILLIRFISLIDCIIMFMYSIITYYVHHTFNKYLTDISSQLIIIFYKEFSF